MKATTVRRKRLERLLELAQAYKGWSRKELARTLGRDPTKLVPGTGIPKLDLVVELAGVLDWPVGDVAGFLWSRRPHGRLGAARAPLAQSGRNELPRAILLVRGHRVLEIQHQRVGARARRLLDPPRVTPGHEQHGASQALTPRGRLLDGLVSTRHSGAPQHESGRKTRALTGRALGTPDRFRDPSGSPRRC